MPPTQNISISIFTDTRHGSDYTLSQQPPRKPGAIQQTIDLADRSTSNNSYYPYPIIRDSLNRSDGLFFISEPLDQPLTVTGSFEGRLRTSINKRDMDIGVRAL